MSRTRQDRERDFQEFYSTSEATFTGFRGNDPKAEKFERIYMLQVAPGSRMGGNNNRIVEVFWGSRPYQTIVTGRQWRFLTEYGATLLFQMDDAGFLAISIHPAGTKNRRPIESSISLRNWTDPAVLKNAAFLKKLWTDFMAYMECTSLDGNPTWSQRLRVSYLRSSKHRVEENKWMPPKFSEAAKEVSKWVAAVVIGAIIVYYVTPQQATNETEDQLKEVNRNLDSIFQELKN